MSEPAVAERERLEDWLRRLVRTLLDGGGPVRTLLVATVTGRAVTIRIDDVALRVSASAADGGIALSFDDPGAGAHDPALHTTGDALRAVIAGRRLLDAAIVSGDIALRAPLPDLLAFHELVMKTLALGPRSRALRQLWEEFDAAWRHLPPDCSPLEAQRPRHAALLDTIPAHVLAVQPAITTGRDGEKP